MKSTGIVRKVDELGRVVLPKELRRVFNLNQADSLEIYTEEDRIILKKYHPSCIFCDNASNTTNYKNKLICDVCLSDIKADAIV